MLAPDNVNCHFFLLRFPLLKIFPIIHLDLVDSYIAEMKSLFGSVKLSYSESRGYSTSHLVLISFLNFLRLQLIPNEERYFQVLLMRFWDLELDPFNPHLLY